MKKTYNINISGYGFVIDEDAYEMLDSYLKTLTQVCDRADEPETAADIEQRIAELLGERLSESERTIITLRDVEAIIDRMGQPEEIIVECEPEGCTVETVSTEENRAVPPTPPVAMHKRLYRDVDNKVLGGVCSGLGWYFGIDAVWIRIIAIIIFFASASTMALIYIALWVCIPAARTPYERMQMMGVDPSVSNVGKVVTGGYTRPEMSDSGMGAGRVIYMIIMIFLLIVVGALLLGFFTATAGGLVGLLFSPLGGGMIEMTHARLIMGCVVGGALVAGIPCFYLFRHLLGAVNNRSCKSLSVPQNVILLVLWLLGVAAVITCGILL